MAIHDIEYRVIKPNPELSDFVESFWMLANHSDEEQEVIILPDGRIDIFFSISATEPYHVTLLGLESEPGKSTILPNTVNFAISLKLLAVEYVLDTHIAPFLNTASDLPADFFGFTANDLQDFSEFCAKASDTMAARLDRNIDERKRKLFDLIYTTNGAIPVKELSETVSWSSRQINRYFNQRFGISLKAYCTILRFRASFQHIKEGKLFPEQNFADQAHFIRDVKKYAGVAPKELSRNQNDRFIQFSTLPKS
ncbi:AraC family transcriptional regulator [Spirosoma sp. KNUC1025]|uniref:helix-turn-helix domain-containing protein n=1 Tax=Spirosoma sp. KNUC1025 TaxID=2894082 RepID=UPI0038689102|nr:AraC family transcriptional regulator [Spirosoma sp. KNUC1025]